MTVALVTGANGFIGRHLCAELARRGERVCALMREGARLPPEAAGTWRARPHARETLASVLADLSPSTIYHVAGSARSDDAESLYLANVVYAANLIEAALRMPRRPTLILVGSAAEYGRVVPAAARIAETAVCRPTSAYGVSKLAQTHHGQIAADRGLDVVMVRLFNPIGAGMPATTAFGSVARQIAARGPKGGVIQTGPLGAVRDFIDIADVVRILAGLSTCPGAFGQVVNVCSGVGFRLGELMETLLAAASWPVRHVVDPAIGASGDLPNVVGDPGRLRALGFTADAPDFERLFAAMIEAERSPS